jgi:hypothetical protein
MPWEQALNETRWACTTVAGRVWSQDRDEAFIFSKPYFR